MLKVFGKGLFGSFSVILSIVITSLVLLWLWNIFNPGVLLYQLVLLVILFIVGVILFFALAFFFTLVSMLFFLFLLRRRIRKSFKKMFSKPFE